MIFKWVAVPKGRLIRAIVTAPGKPRSTYMYTYTQVPQRVFIDGPEGLSATTSMDVQSGTDVAHSEKNILQWMVYLPEGCVRTMIQMGWDVTT
jgi:hypothetical protein